MSNRYIHLKDGTTWPVPNWCDDNGTGIEWKLRYAPKLITDTDKLYLASVVSAYTDLVHGKTQKRVVEVISNIRKELKEHP